MARHAKNEDDGGDSRGIHLIAFWGSPSAQDGPPEGGVLTQKIKASAAFLAAVAALITAIVGFGPSDPEKQAPGVRTPPRPPYAVEEPTPTSEQESAAAQGRQEPPAEAKRSSARQKPAPEPTTTTTGPELTTTSELPTPSEHVEPTTTTTTTETTTSTTPPGENERPNLLAAAGSVLLGVLEPDAFEPPEPSTTPEADTIDTGDEEL